MIVKVDINKIGITIRLESFSTTGIITRTMGMTPAKWLK